LSDRDSRVEDIARWAQELTAPRQHVEPILDDNGYGRKTVRRAWTTTVPSLLDQLRQMAHEGLRVGSRPPGSVGKPSSRPPGNFEALAVSTSIMAGASYWAVAYAMCFDQRNAAGIIRALVGISSLLDDESLYELHREVRHWHAMASLATGWREPPWSPAVRCPACGSFGTLRVDADARSAYCGSRARRGDGRLACAMSWPEGTTTELFAYIRHELEGAA
jgi:hypothetical protein